MQAGSFLSPKVKLIFSGLTLLFIGIFVVLTTHPPLKQTETPQSEQTLGISTNSSPSPTVIPLTPTSTPVPTAAPLKRAIALGFWTEGLWTDSTLTIHPEALLSVESLLNKKVAIAHFYTGWENLGKPTLLYQLQTVSNNGWEPMLSINPYFTSSCQVGGKSLYSAIGSGNCDSLLHDIGRSIKAYGRPLLLRFAWEMNVDSMDWSIQKTGSLPSDYIGAWRHFHDIVVSEGGTNAAWVFAPNTATATSIPYSALYPGDSYVDWIGLDGYNWGTTKSWSSWQSFSTIFTPSYQALVAIAPTKPMMLSEVNSADQGGNKASWYTDMLSNQLPYHFPHIKAVVFYNENRMTQENVNWLINSSPEALSALRTALQNPLYRSSL